MAEGAAFKSGKFKELVLYLSQASREDEGFGMVKLNKLLYLADFESFRLLGDSITGETYVRQEFGPVASHLPIALDELAQRGYLEWQLLPAGPRIRKVPAATEGADTRQFTKAELSIVEQAIRLLKPHGGKSVSEWSHEDSVGWNEVEDGQPIPYHSAFFSMDEIPDVDVERARQLAVSRNWAAVRP
jgi:hypothetical protein